MRILIHASCHSARPSGALARLCSLYGEVARNQPNFIFYITLAADTPPYSCFSEFNNVKFINTGVRSNNLLGRLLWTLFRLPKLLEKLRIDICEFHFLPFFKLNKIRTIGLIHDLRWVHHGGIIKRWFFKAIISRSLRSVSKIVAVSDSVKRELCREFATPQHMVTTIYNPAAKRGGALSGVSFSDSKLKFPSRKYLISVGHLEERKNLLRLLEAFAFCVTSKNLQLDLVLVGNDSGMKNQLLTYVGNNNLSKHVFFFENTSDQQRDFLVMNAEAAIYPSLEEGFGIPIIESLSFGKRVAASNIEVFREIGGPWLYRFDPFSVAEISSTILDLSMDDPSRTPDQGELARFLFRYDLSELAKRVVGLLYASSSGKNY